MLMFDSIFVGFLHRLLVFAASFWQGFWVPCLTWAHGPVGSRHIAPRARGLCLGVRDPRLVRVQLPPGSSSPTPGEGDRPGNGNGKPKKRRRRPASASSSSTTASWPAATAHATASACARAAPDAAAGASASIPAPAVWAARHRRLSVMAVSQTHFGELERISPPGGGALAKILQGIPPYRGLCCSS